jgi:hypothetical protein
MADRRVIPDRRRRVPVEMDHDVILEIRSPADPDRTDIAVQHGTEPDAGAGTDLDIADDRGVWRDEDIVRDLRA